MQHFKVLKIAATFDSSLETCCDGRSILETWYNPSKPTLSYYDINSVNFLSCHYCINFQVTFMK